MPSLKGMNTSDTLVFYAGPDDEYYRYNSPEEYIDEVLDNEWNAPETRWETIARVAPVLVVKYKPKEADPGLIASYCADWCVEHVQEAWDEEYGPPDDTSITDEELKRLRAAIETGIVVALYGKRAWQCDEVERVFYEADELRQMFPEDDEVADVEPLFPK